MFFRGAEQNKISESEKITVVLLQIVFHSFRKYKLLFDLQAVVAPVTCLLGSFWAVRLV